MRCVHAVVFASACLVLPCIISCTGGQKETARAPQVDEEYHLQPPRDTLPQIMQAKLAHAHAVLEGLALSDYRQVEVNATALVEISQRSDWLVHDTPSYFSLSENFRKAAQALADAARKKDMTAVSQTYGSLTGSCIACHRYLQGEKPTLDMPGKMSKNARGQAIQGE